MKDATQWLPYGIISGGQTGVDRGGLEAGIACRIKIGGWVTQGRRAEDGCIPDRYPMWEIKGDRGYATRTRANIVEAAATLILSRGPPTHGTLFTKNECELRGKEYLVIDLNEGDEINICKIKKWLSEKKPNVINVAGPREKRMPGIQAQTEKLLIAVLQGSSSSQSTMIL